MHLFGITFYGVFASGELQDWAEPPNTEQQVWSPTKAGYAAETSFVSIIFIHTSTHRVISFLLFVSKYTKSNKFSFKNHLSIKEKNANQFDNKPCCKE